MSVFRVTPVVCLIALSACSASSTSTENAEMMEVDSVSQTSSDVASAVETSGDVASANDSADDVASGEDVADTIVDEPPANIFAGLDYDAQTALYTDIETRAAALGATAVLPASGTANYEGVAQIFETLGPFDDPVPENVYLVTGEAVLEVDFAVGVPTGEIGNLIEADAPYFSGRNASGTPVEGGFTIDETGTVTGTVTKTTGEVTAYKMTGPTDFFGDDADVLSHTVAGLIDNNNGIKRFGLASIVAERTGD